MKVEGIILLLLVVVCMIRMEDRINDWCIDSPCFQSLFSVTVSITIIHGSSLLLTRNVDMFDFGQNLFLLKALRVVSTIFLRFYARYSM